jgi:mRNA interferase RelE/StbE
VPYELKPSKDSIKFVERLDKKLKRKLGALFKTLKLNPLPFKEYDLKKLKGTRNFYRIRIGKIRVIYEIKELEKRIYIHFIGYRGKAY